MSDWAGHVLDVGNCDPDHAMIRRMLTENFDVSVDRVMSVDEAIRCMRQTSHDLVLFNGLIFADSSAGIELLTRARSDAALKTVPIMMISNQDEAQEACVAAGGRRGFGKAAIFEPSTVELLSAYLPRR